ncbi:HD domain-containing phosphohydrolase [Rhizobacter sp. P5_C2]
MNTPRTLPFAPFVPRICVIDDNPVVGVRMQKLLNTRGFRNVTVFRSAWPALQACHYRLPDLVLVDYGMPQIDGIRFIEALRHYPPARTLPIVMFTGQSLETLRPRAMEAGASDVLSKDLTGEELLRRVKGLLSAAQARFEMAAPSLAAPVLDRVLLADAGREGPASHGGWGLLAQYEQKAEITDEDESTLRHLSRIASLRDRNTGQHTERMAYYAAVIGRRYGLSLTQAQMLVAAAPLHDIGKVGVPDAVLHKSGSLDDDERTLMRRHPALGFELLRDSSSAVIRLGAEISLSHHERFDGSGYPQGLRGHEIPLSGRLVAVADVLDALSTERPYKAAWPLHLAIREISAQAGTHFDPAVVSAMTDASDQLLTIKQYFEMAEPFAKTTPMTLI